MEIKREPIHKIEPSEPLEVQIVFKQLNPEFFLPEYEYSLRDKVISSEAGDLKEFLNKFLMENSDLITNGSDLQLKELECYAKGFKNAVAMTHLWIDSMYVVDTPL